MLVHIKPTVLESMVAGMLERICNGALIEDGYIVILKQRHQVDLFLYSGGKKDVQIIWIHPVHCQKAVTTTGK